MTWELLGASRPVRQQQLGLSSGSARGRQNPFQHDQELSRMGTKRCPPGCWVPGFGGRIEEQNPAAGFPQFNPKKNSEQGERSALHHVL